MIIKSGLKSQYWTAFTYHDQGDHTVPVGNSCKAELDATTQNRYTLRISASTHDQLIVPETKTQFGERSFTVDGPKVWNQLPNIDKNAESVGTVKSRLKTHLLNWLMIFNVK